MRRIPEVYRKALKRAECTLAAGSVPAALMMLWVMAGVDRNSVSVADATTLSLG